MKLIMIIGLFFSVNSFADYKELSERLVKIRQEIEILNTELDSQQKLQNSQFEGLVSRKLELEVQIKKEKLKSLQLNEKKLSLKNRLSPKKGLSIDEKKMVSNWQSDLVKWVNSSLPYKKEERLLTLDKIEESIKANNSLHDIVGDLWRFSEKEIELVRHNRFEVINLEINGKKSTAEVARIGLLTMAFKLPSDDFGFAKKSNGKWDFVVAQKSDELTAAKRLLTKFKDKNYSGLFELPIADL